MDVSRWRQLQRLTQAASEEPSLQVWLFGSALHSDEPSDLDVLLIYEDRQTVVAVRSRECWADCSPPVHIIAMTPREEREYDFVVSTRARRLA